MIAAEEQYRQLLSERARFNSRIESLPDTQQKLFSLRRDVEVLTKSISYYFTKHKKWRSREQAQLVTFE